MRKSTRKSTCKSTRKSEFAISDEYAWKLQRIRDTLTEVPFEKISLREQNARLDLALELLADFQGKTKDQVRSQLNAY